MPLTTAKRLILASASPRRRELLTQAGVEFEALTSEFPEIPLQGEAPQAYVARNAQSKALAVRAQHAARAAECVILGADTIVVSPAGRLLEKPANETEARTMLESLRGSAHEVLSGVALVSGTTGQLLEGFTTRTVVAFRQLSDDEIRRYVATREPFDKAGGYGIQGSAAGFVDSISGSYTNVVGLPLSQVLEALNRHRLWR